MGTSLAHIGTGPNKGRGLTARPRVDEPGAIPGATPCVELLSHADLRFRKCCTHGPERGWCWLCSLAVVFSICLRRVSCEVRTRRWGEERKGSSGPQHFGKPKAKRTCRGHRGAACAATAPPLAWPAGACARCQRCHCSDCDAARDRHSRAHAPSLSSRGASARMAERDWLEARLRAKWRLHFK